MEARGSRFLLLLLVGAIILVAISFYPLASALILATGFAAVVWPLNQKLARRLGRKRARPLAAGLICSAFVVLVLGPVIGLSAFFVNQANEGLQFIATTAKSEGVNGLLERLPDSVEKPARRIIEQFVGEVSHDDKKLEKALGDQVAAQGGNAAGVLSTVVSATGSLLFLALMMLIAFYFLLAEGEKLVEWLDANSPLGRGRTIALLSAVRKVAVSVIKSELLTALVQAGAALVGYLIARVPNPVFFTVVTFFIAFIPAIGAGSVCLAAAGLLWLTGHPYMALFLGIWALTAVALIDNVLKPFLIKDEAQLHGGIVFFSLLGGLAAFGAIGLLIGPVSVALLLELIRMYRTDFLRESSAK